MQTKVNFSSLASSDSSVNTNFNVVVVYEDFETGKSAKKICDFLAGNLGPNCRVTQQMWKFAVLEIPNLRDMAVKDAAQADVIIVASQGTNRFPAAFKQWAEQWLEEKPNAMALVALFAAPAYESEVCQRSRAYLSQLATRGRMEFFAQPDSLLGSARFQIPINDHQTASTFASYLDRDVSFPRWGINE